MAQRPAFVVAAAGTGVVRRGGITAIERRGQRAITDLADEATVADGLEFSIPARGDRQPDFEIDMRIAGRRGERDYAAEGIRDGQLCRGGPRGGGGQKEQRARRGGGGEGARAPHA